ncbi:hypothetical protein Q7P35_003210 [Cladosporium inversicolor]
MTTTTSADNPDLLVCVACGTEFDQPADKPLDNCVICDVRSIDTTLSNLAITAQTHLPQDRAEHHQLTSQTKPQDPRQYVPPTGQSWTSRSQLASNNKKYTNTRSQIDSNPNFYSLITTPKFAIGQRAILVKTPNGNVLWDCLTLLDDATITWIKSQGGLKAIVISHPHYYSSHLTWAATFDCPVYISAADAEWVQRADHWNLRRLLPSEPTQIIPGITALTTGGHFPGSLVLHASSPSPDSDEQEKPRLLIADTLMTVPSALYAKNRPAGTTSFAFMWSIPNMIPLPPGEMQKMWKAMEEWEFGSTHGAFIGMDVRDGDGGERSVKERARESMRIQARGEGWEGSLGEEWP